MTVLLQILILTTICGREEKGALKQHLHCILIQTGRHGDCHFYS